MKVRAISFLLAAFSAACVFEMRSNLTWSMTAEREAAMVSRRLWQVGKMGVLYICRDKIREGGNYRAMQQNIVG
jgi:hypothetical protein